MMNNFDAGAASSLPLSGKRILVTRAPHQASELAERLSALGATPVLIPTIEIGPPESFAALDGALGALPGFDLVAFTSANAVQAFKERADLLGMMPAPKRVAVVGPATARAVEAIGLRADVLPPVFTGRATRVAGACRACSADAGDWIDGWRRAGDRGCGVWESHSRGFAGGGQGVVC